MNAYFDVLGRIHGGERMRDKRDLVSIIIPVHNRAKLLSRTLRSAIGQTYHHTEILVVDDGSTDNPESVVSTFDDPRIKYIRHAVNRGAGAARNTGIANATGQFIAFLDSDDVWHNAKLDLQLAVFRSSSDEKLLAVSCGHTLVTLKSDGRSLSRSTSIPRAHGQVNILRQWATGLVHVGLLVRRSLMDPPVLFDETLPALEDWDYLVRITRRGHIDFVPESLMTCYIQRDRVHNPANRAQAWRQLIEKYAGDLSVDRRLKSKFHCRLAVHEHLAGDHKRMYASLMSALTTDPFEFRHYVRILLAITGSSWWYEPPSFTRRASRAAKVGTYEKIRDGQ